MQLPATDDTIIAVSSAWEPAQVGVIRLSGPRTFGLLAAAGITPPPARCPRATRHTVRRAGGRGMPADVIWFQTPRSYTGQDLVEIHTVGALPLLRMVAADFLRLGARRALPGEFTSRAFLNGKLDADEVDAVLELVNCADASAARRAARGDRRSHESLFHDLHERLLDLLAAVEAGIDFTDEEDVRFITPGQFCRAIDGLCARMDVASRQPAGLQNAVKTHVALAGLPNAGKSTLFNSLLGFERAIVSPVLGTTRDVLSAETCVGGSALVLQDCAGLGRSPDELELAAHLAAERTADEADLILWVHATTESWTDVEIQACGRLLERPVVLVNSKADLPHEHRPSPRALEFMDVVETSGATGAGIDALAACINRHVNQLRATDVTRPIDERLGGVRASLSRAREVASQAEHEITSPDAVAFELREGLMALELLERGPVGEEVLARIFGNFCIGK